MNTSRALLLLSCSLAACSSPSAPTSTIPCPSGQDCGQQQFRSAVPTAAQVRLDHPTGTTKARRRTPISPGPAMPSANVSRSHPVALAAVSSALLSVDQQVDTIDTVVDGMFDDLDKPAGTTPEIETDAQHRWRTADTDLPGHDAVLDVTTDDGTSFDVAYYLVATGQAPGGSPLISGQVTPDVDLSTFQLTIDLDAYTKINPSFDGHGKIVAAVMPFDAGISEHWFDFHAVSFGNDPAQTSRTTAWGFAEGSGALEYLDDIDGSAATVYARWDERGGRYDHHLAYVDPDIGPANEIATNCWNPTGAEDFDAWAVIDENNNYYGQIDGNEDDCVFGPVADHPDPGHDFDDLPAAGDWAGLYLQSWCGVSGSC